MTKYHNLHLPLTSREQEVYEFIIKGNTTKNIAEKLAVGFETIKTHRKNIYRKLKVKTGIELISVHHQKLIS